MDFQDELIRIIIIVHGSWTALKSAIYLVTYKYEK